VPPPPAENLRRSVDLFRAFRVEQTDPDRFYGLLAADSVGQLSGYTDLADSTVLDVGGGPGYFGAAFRSAGARYLPVEADVGELAARGAPQPGSVIGDGMRLPVRSGTVDVCFSSNVLEHVRDPWRMAEEMVRVTRPGGLVYLSYNSWFAPNGGHETAPWHYLGGDYARRRYLRRRGHEPKNRFGESLFVVRVADALSWARRCAAVQVLAAKPRYHPSWAQWVVRIPGVREVAVWNLLLVLRKR
jgi:SAM-dependent methyltransferase